MNLFAIVAAGIASFFSRSGPKQVVDGAAKSVTARYDAAQTNAQNRNHWSAADSLSALGANNPAVRMLLRNRARYETANNGYLAGIKRTLGIDCVGVGPTLQVRTADKAANEVLESNWRSWCEATRLAVKLRTMRRARMVDGEAFALLITNRRLSTRVKLDVKPIEADQIAAPDRVADVDLQDGIRFDESGNPLSYFVLRAHPGDPRAIAAVQYDEVPAEFVLHYYEPDRADERRGVPEILATLGLAADGRRYRGAVVAAAETAANQGVVLHTPAPADATNGTAKPFEEIPIPKNNMLVLPDGYQATGFKPEQPTTTHREFVRSLVNETARPLCMPYNVAAGDSSDYNYASGRLDHQSYFASIVVEQDLIRLTVLERVFAAWLSEAALGVDELAEAARRFATVPHQWLWPGSEHVDPLKEADAQETRLRSGVTTRTRELAQQGIDVEQHDQELLLDLQAQVQRTGEVIKMAKAAGVPENIAVAIALPQLSPLILTGGNQPGNQGNAGAGGNRRPKVVREDGEDNEAA